MFENAAKSYADAAKQALEAASNTDPDDPSASIAATQSIAYALLAVYEQLRDASGDLGRLHGGIGDLTEIVSAIALRR